MEGSMVIILTIFYVLLNFAQLFSRTGLIKASTNANHFLGAAT